MRRHRRGTEGRGGNLAVLLVSVLLSYTVLELGWRHLLDRMPFSLHAQLGFLDVLAQPSKKAVLPEPGYVAIIGDSYAEGLGDRLMQVVWSGNPKFNAGHALHDLTGRDVLSFGFRGGFPLWTYTYDLTAAIEGINRYDGLELPAAGDVIAYFYEGNDVSDTMRYLRFGLPEGSDFATVTRPEGMRRRVEEFAADGHHRAHRRWYFYANAHLAETGSKLVKLAIKNWSRKGPGLLAPEDASLAVSRTYAENWSRYEASKYFVLAGGKRLPYPAPTVESFGFHTADEIAITALSLRESLANVKRLFPGARLWVAYIPSPLNVYTPAQPEFAVQNRLFSSLHDDRAGEPMMVSTQQLARVSDAICQAMAEQAAAIGARFVDTRLPFRQAADATGYLHGPNDPGHLNGAGYAALAAILADGLAGKLPDGCGQLSR